MSGSMPEAFGESSCSPGPSASAGWWSTTDSSRIEGARETYNRLMLRFATAAGQLLRELGGRLDRWLRLTGEQCGAARSRSRLVR
jgi:hypothetical protein